MFNHFMGVSEIHFQGGYNITSYNVSSLYNNIQWVDDKCEKYKLPNAFQIKNMKSIVLKDGLSIILLKIQNIKLHFA